MYPGSLRFSPDGKTCAELGETITLWSTADGSLVQWQRSSGVPLPLAVASSCAVPWVYPPVTINGRRYMDGGARSATNADLAAGHGR